MSNLPGDNWEQNLINGRFFVENGSPDVSMSFLIIGIDNRVVPVWNLEKSVGCIGWQP
jgi:hypothetical protein